MTDQLSSTATIIRSAERLHDRTEFFGRFRPAWAEVRERVNKLETRQVYREPGNPSWEKLMQGDFEAAVAMVPEVRRTEIPLYKSLAERGVEFVRCRPIVTPPTTYLRWELECYDFNSSHGERIFALDGHENRWLFERHALHDFMTFDNSLALIHDYDDAGEIRGGWQVRSSSDVSELLRVFSAIRERSVEYSQFLSAHGLR